VAFASLAANLLDGGGDTNGCDIFVATNTSGSENVYRRQGASNQGSPAGDIWRWALRGFYPRQ
jgi:hypothetical protein